MMGREDKRSQVQPNSFYLDQKNSEELDKSTPVEFSWTTIEGASSYRLEIRDLQDAPLFSAIVLDPTLKYQAPSWLKDKIGAAVVHWRVTAFDDQQKLITETDWSYFKFAPSPIVKD